MVDDQTSVISGLIISYSDNKSYEQAKCRLLILMCAGHGTILAGESPVMGNLPLM